MKLTQEYTAQVDCLRLCSSKGMDLRTRIAALSVDYCLLHVWLLLFGSDMFLKLGSNIMEGKLD